MVELQFETKDSSHRMYQLLTKRMLTISSVKLPKLTIPNEYEQPLYDACVELFYLDCLMPLMVDRLTSNYHYDVEKDLRMVNQIMRFISRLLLTDNFIKSPSLYDYRRLIIKHFCSSKINNMIMYAQTCDAFFYRFEWLIDDIIARAIDEIKLDETYAEFLLSSQKFLKHKEKGPSVTIQAVNGKTICYQMGGLTSVSYVKKEDLLALPINLQCIAYDFPVLAFLIHKNPAFISFPVSIENKNFIRFLKRLYGNRICISAV
ncbi:hypothetical protein SAMN05421734_10385 [Pelagirhabdus alkalitolerans]|uniref:Sporulation protein YtxC n=1 Tax=Pelagirhabdus alkalitolerans TaxID=1612202 RepID=A0A1G6HKP7_9BACI|nr:hypothetical protein [Pelagirhabdus alkalitolerans]SDB94809.1 hypothetical protein SAMN05421734_10385 [Pelagirhabdus alkalitolerans]